MPVRPGGVCPVCGVTIDKRARTCRAHATNHLTPDHQRAAISKRWPQQYGGGDMSVIQAVPIRPYEGPSWLIEIAGQWKRGTNAVGRDEEVKVLERNIMGWGPGNAIIEVTNRDGWRRHLLAELRDEGKDTE